MLPEHTQVERLESLALVSIDDARAWVGLYGDTSLDDELSSCLQAAIESVSNWLDAVITNIRVTDFYPRSTRSFTPSQSSVSRISSTDRTPVVTLSYYNDQNDVIVVGEDDFNYDPTTHGLEFFLDDEFNSVNINQIYTNPWRLQYTNDVRYTNGLNSDASVTLAVRILTSRYWTYRGGIDPNPNATDRAVSNILGPAKTVDWYVRIQGVD